MIRIMLTTQEKIIDNNQALYRTPDSSNEIKIDKANRFYRTEAIWAYAEFYFYGKITDAGGKDKANIHVYTEELGTMRIQTPITFLEQYDENILYRYFSLAAGDSAPVCGLGSLYLTAPD